MLISPLGITYTHTFKDFISTSIIFFDICSRENGRRKKKQKKGERERDSVDPCKLISPVGLTTPITFFFTWVKEKIGEKIRREKKKNRKERKG